MRLSPIDPLAAAEKRWTVFSSFWFLVMECKYFGIPPALRYIFYLAWRAIMQQVYQTHKAVVLWREYPFATPSGVA